MEECELVLISSFDQFLENYRGIKLGFSCTDKTWTLGEKEI